ncbi:MAG: tetratricopeptide repeat protein [Candidatus Omnitrophica bacterium]|nr:tetratricopeptide repeat protein [Candidatus Omnitrophota bacterium]
MRVKIVAIIMLCLFLVPGAFADDEGSKEAELLFMAKKAYEDGFYEVSLGMLERFEKEYASSPAVVQAALLSGQCYFYQSRYLEALNVFEALMNNPQAGNLQDALYFWMGQVHSKGNNFEKAALFYQKLIDNFPRSAFVPEAHYSLGWAFFQEGRFDQSKQAFKSLMEKFPREPQSKDAAFKLIECLYNLKEYSELKSGINLVFKLYNNDALHTPYLYFYLAESEYYLDHLDEAAKNYLKSAQAFKEPKAQALAKLGLGWSYLKLSRYKETEDVFSEIKSGILDKKSLDIFLLGQAVLMSATNRVYEAKKLYERIINQSMDPLILTQAYLGKADVHYNLAEYPQAVNAYREGLKRLDQDKSANLVPRQLLDKLRYGLGLAYLKQGQVSSSVEIFNSIAENESVQGASISLLFQIAQAYEDANELIKSEEIYARIINLYPGQLNTDYAQYQLASLQLKRRDYDSAIISLQSMLKKYPQSRFLPEAVYALGMAYFQQSDFAQSYQIFLRFKEEFKDSPLRAQALYMLAAALISLERADEALGVFKEISKLDSLEMELRQKVEYEIADCYYKLGQEDEAVSRFKFLRAKYPDSKLAPDIMWWLGQYYYRNKDLNLARRYFDSLAKDFPESRLAADAFYALGLIFSEEDKNEQAADNFKKVIKSGHPDLRVQAASALADIYSREGKPQEALAQYNEMLKDVPDISKAFFPRIAQAYYRVGNYNEAKSFYLKSLDVVSPGEVADIRFSLAEVFEANAEPDAAVKQYLLSADLYAQQSPQLFVRSLLRAARIYEDKENFNEALKVYKRIIQVHPSAAEAGFIQERIDWIKENVKVAGGRK